ncbi:hypothetical protein PS907_05417 [Pseudomonas fluorescens]|nr:hypothetical protein PS907_05417 [Pseudomonas fluorescens]
MRQRVTPAKPQPAVHFHCTGAVQACPLKRQNPVQGPIGQGQQFLARDHRHRATVRGGFVRRRSGIPIGIASSRRHVIHVLFLLQHRVLPRLPAHLHRALPEPANHAANRDRLVAIHRLHERRQNRQKAPDKSHRRIKNPRSVLDQPQAQIRHTRCWQGDGQHRANHQVNQQRYHEPSRHFGNFVGGQCVQPDHRCAQQQVQRGFITGE